MSQPAKVIGVISSAHRNGNTAALVREVLRGAAAAGAAVEEVFLPEQRIEFCNGCFRCTAEGQCPLADDFGTIRDRLWAADGIVLGSPTYAGTLNAEMKRLFERLGMFERLTSSLGGKYIVGVSTCAGMGAKRVADNLARLISGGLFRRGYISGSLGVSLRGKQAADLPEILARAGELGKRLVRDIRGQRRYRLQNLGGRILNRWILRPNFQKIILQNKNGAMKGVYENLNRRGLLP